jgi:hypothetical protein
VFFNLPNGEEKKARVSLNKLSPSDTDKHLRNRKPALVRNWSGYLLIIALIGFKVVALISFDFKAVERSAVWQEGRSCYKLL